MGLEEKLVQTAPHWIKGTESTDPDEMGWGYAYLAILGYAIRSVSGYEGAAHEAARARFVSLAPSDALPHAAADADVPRFVSGDTEGELRNRIADAWGFHSRVGKESGIAEVLEIVGFDPTKVWILDTSTGAYAFNTTWWSAFAIATRDPLTWSIGSKTTKTQDLYAYAWKYKWAHAVPVYINVVEGTGYTHDLLQAEGLTHAAIAAASLTHEGLADASSELVRLAYTHQDLAAEGLSHAQIASAGRKHRRGLTAV